ncbi:MAG: hypothetical protein ABI690_22400 [Chloroflexota bacterium]
MSDDPQNKPMTPEDSTIPSAPKKSLPDDSSWDLPQDTAASAPHAETPARPNTADDLPAIDAPPPRREAVARAASKLAASGSAPVLLQQFFNDQIDLSAELVTRFPSLPLMSVIRFRKLQGKSQRGVATLSTPDGVAAAVIDADATSGSIQLSFSYGSMMSLRFRMDELSSMDRSRWLELMRRDQGGVAFLWGQARWEQDYVICVTRRHFASIYAFSHHGFEAAVRLTPDVTKQLLDWLEKFWHSNAPGDEPPKLLTW